MAEDTKKRKNEVTGESLSYNIEPGIMPKLWKMNNSGSMTVSPYCCKPDASASKCSIKKSMTETFAMTPYPEVFQININWFSDHTKYLETFYFSISIALEFNISDMFEVQSKSSAQKEKMKAATGSDKLDERYMLMGLVCFVGAHYLSFIKSDLNGKVIWKLFDDEKPILVYQSWEAVLNNILEYGNLPTLLIYEKKSDLNKHLAEKELTLTQVRNLKNRAEDL